MNPDNNLLPSLQASPAASEDKPKHSARNFFVILFVVMILLGVSSPVDTGATALLFYGVFGLGVTAALSIIASEFKRYKRTVNPVVKIFVLLASIGIAIFVFFISVFAALFAYVAKDPDSIQCG